MESRQRFELLIARFLEQTRVLGWSPRTIDAYRSHLGFFLTYCIGGVWIGLTNGEILDSYFRDRFYIPAIADLGSMYWTVLLAPLIVPICIVAMLLPRLARRRPMHVSRVSSPCGPFIVTLSALCAYAVYRIFHGGNGVVAALLKLISPPSLGA